MPGDDTRCKVTILDEDFPGKLGFEETAITCSRKDKQVQIKVQRIEGCDGQIQCTVKTEPLIEGNTDDKGGACAREFDHYVPIEEVINFAHGEQEYTLNIDILDKCENELAHLENVKKEEG